MADIERHVLIAGGGIGGLAASIALARGEFHSTVLERSSFAEESGAGIQLGPNATSLLRRLGVLDQVEAVAFKPEALWLFDGISGRRLTVMPLGQAAEQRYGAPYLTLHRADLHAGLLSVCKTMPAVELRPGFDVARIEEHTGVVTAISTEGARAEASWLVGADGLWSAVRGYVAPGARLRFAGATASRALLSVSNLPAPFDAPVVGLWLGPRAHLVHYPVRGGSHLNVVAVTEGGSESEGWNQQGDSEALLSGFARWCKASKALLERPSAWRRWSLYRLRPLAHWSTRRVALLGDSAHPVLPYLAQGAALAIEDAVSLATNLEMFPGDPPVAFRQYEAERQARAVRVQRLSRRFGAIYHLSGPMRLARNFVLSRRSAAATLARFDWLYGASPRS